MFCDFIQSYAAPAMFGLPPYTPQAHWQQQQPTSVPAQEYGVSTLRRQCPLNLAEPSRRASHSSSHNSSVTSTGSGGASVRHINEHRAARAMMPTTSDGLLRPLTTSPVSVEVCQEHLSKNQRRHRAKRLRAAAHRQGLFAESQSDTESSDISAVDFCSPDLDIEEIRASRNPSFSDKSVGPLDAPSLVGTPNNTKKGSSSSSSSIVTCVTTRNPYAACMKSIYVFYPHGEEVRPHIVSHAPGSLYWVWAEDQLAATYHDGQKVAHVTADLLLPPPAPVSSPVTCQQPSPFTVEVPDAKETVPGPDDADFSHCPSTTASMAVPARHATAPLRACPSPVDSVAVADEAGEKKGEELVRASARLGPRSSMTSSPQADSSSSHNTFFTVKTPVTTIRAYNNTTFEDCVAHQQSCTCSTVAAKARKGHRLVLLETHSSRAGIHPNTAAYFDPSVMAASKGYTPAAGDVVVVPSESHTESPGSWLRRTELQTEAMVIATVKQVLDPMCASVSADFRLTFLPRLQRLPTEKDLADHNKGAATGAFLVSDFAKLVKSTAQDGDNSSALQVFPRAQVRWYNSITAQELRRSGILDDVEFVGSEVSLKCNIITLFYRENRPRTDHKGLVRSLKPKRSCRSFKGVDKQPGSFMERELRSTHRNRVELRCFAATEAETLQEEQRLSISALIRLLVTASAVHLACTRSPYLRVVRV